MKIQRRDFLKMLGAFGGAMVAEGLAPKGIIKPGEIMLPETPTVVTALPGMTVGRSDVGEIHIRRMDISYMNNIHEDSFIDEPAYRWITRPEWILVNLDLVTDEVGARKLGEWWRANKTLPFWHTEWLCIFCGSPQPVPQTHCSQCGAARDWVVT